MRLEAGSGPAGRVRGGGEILAGVDVPVTSRPAVLLRAGQDKWYQHHESTRGEGGLTFIVGVELVLRTVLGLLNDQFPSLNIDFELQFLRNPQRL